MTIGIDEVAPPPEVPSLGWAVAKEEGARIRYDHHGPRPDPREFQGEVRLLRWLDEEKRLGRWAGGYTITRQVVEDNLYRDTNRRFAARVETAYTSDEPTYTPDPAPAVDVALAVDMVADMVSSIDVGGGFDPGGGSFGGGGADGSW